ncbi:MAG TPA: menaquinone biosynthesis protein [Terriglobales bacterium]|nr:menaquinone biosynthesis protein [Terriglobales bacterium]
MRISAISYLNTAPLMWDFEHGLDDPSFEISYTVPSQCALQLQQGTADIGIIPSAAYASIPDLSILPGVAIASKQAVRSILLVSRKPITKISTVALDNSSLTSVALTRILFEKYWHGNQRFHSLSPNLDAMLAHHDAALLIGDPALKVDRSRYRTWDLAEEWIRFTGKPFVFAFWAVRDEAARSSNLDLPAAFQKSRNHGLQPDNLKTIARTWSEKLGLPEKDIHEYLTSNIFYYLEEECIEGLRLFYRYAYECKALPKIPELNFSGVSTALI